IAVRSASSRARIAADRGVRTRVRPADAEASRAARESESRTTWHVRDERSRSSGGNRRTTESPSAPPPRAHGSPRIAGPVQGFGPPTPRRAELRAKANRELRGTSATNGADRAAATAARRNRRPLRLLARTDRRGSQGPYKDSA